MKNIKYFYAILIYFNVHTIILGQFHTNLQGNNCTSEEYFPCNNNQCIEAENFCDGIADCADHSDETEFHCKNRVCPRHAFQCKYGGCISAYKKCDNKFDCFDGSDEYASACKTCPSDDFFRCDTGHCILMENICNGKKDCLDGSDETQVLCSSQPVCTGYEFTCNYGACILKSKLCDGISDCADDSDESENSCKFNICPLKFRCRYGGCINMNQRCDGIVNCVDQSDEDPGYAGCAAKTTEAPKVIELPIFSPVASTITKVSNGCIVPALNNTRIFFMDKSKNEILNANAIVPNYKFITYECINSKLSSKYKMKIETSKSYCINNEWTAKSHPECFPTCNKQVLDAVSYKALCNNEPCLGDIFPGTIVDLRCNFGYTDQESTFRIQNIKCDNDGEWDYQPQRCIPNCGIIPTGVVSLMANGRKTNIQQVPWHVGIYSNKLNPDKYEQICGGTIINAKVVLTAAHCFSINAVTINESDKQYYKVVVGKNTRPYVPDEQGTQVFNIVDLYFRSGFQGYYQNYHYDFAILNLNRPIVFGANVKPICLDPVDIKDRSIDSGTTGIVAGWGEINSRGESSHQLLSINLTAISYTECIQDSDSVKSSVSGDKFCVVYNRTSKHEGKVCQGDSGGGFVIKKFNNRYYLRGILSNSFKIGEINPTCGSSTHATFTNIREYLREIDDYVKNNNPI